MSQRVIDLDQNPTFGRIRNLATRAWKEFVYGLELSGQAWLHANGLQPKRRDV